MTVARLRQEMTQLEFVQWTRYHAARSMLAEMETAEAEARMRRR
jgi:hypothetical protein